MVNKIPDVYRGFCFLLQKRRFCHVERSASEAETSRNSCGISPLPRQTRSVEMTKEPMIRFCVETHHSTYAHPHTQVLHL